MGAKMGERGARCTRLTLMEVLQIRFGRGRRGHARSLRTGYAQCFIDIDNSVERFAIIGHRYGCDNGSGARNAIFDAYATNQEYWAAGDNRRCVFNHRHTQADVTTFIQTARRRVSGIDQAGIDPR
jgi:hypothetical protein